MRLADAEAEVEPPKRCRAGDIIDALDDEDRATFERWTEEGRAGSWITGVLIKAGYPVARDTVRVHLRRECRCYQGAA